MSDGEGLHYIGGKWTPDAPNGYADSLNPANGEMVGRAPLGSTGLAGQAVDAARAAFETTSWASDPRLRSRVLYAFADRLEAQRDVIANLLSCETGKILPQARHEITAAASEVRYFAGLSRNVFGRTFESGPGKMSLMTREARGVCSVIVPWNAPLVLLVRSVAPALAAGCTVVIKPAAQTSLSNAAILGCFDGVEGLPDGVVNSVNDYTTEVGHVLSTHPEIDVVSFTGSSRTGKIIMANAAETIKHVSLELGGKAPAVVFEDADCDLALAEIARAALTLNGQMCTCIARVLLHESLVDEMTARLKAAFEATVVGDPLETGTQLGPLIDRSAQKRMLGIIERAGDEADLILRGTLPGGELAKGCFVTPSIFRIGDVTHPLVQEELFGPIISIETFTDEAEAIAKANATRFGLAASVYTRDLNRAMRMGRKLRFGTVWLNSHNRLMAEVETGGYRESGIGRLHGTEAMNDFLETKHIYYEAEG